MKLKIFIVLVSIFTLLSCASKKKIIITEKATIETVQTVKKDSVLIIEKSLPIKDTLLISLRTNNKKIDSLLNNKLQDFKASKNSGTNKFTVSYDKGKKAIKITASVKGSSNKSLSKNTETTSEKTVNKSQKKEVKIKKSIGFNWWWILILLCLAAIGVFIIRFKFF